MQNKAEQSAREIEQCMQVKSGSNLEKGREKAKPQEDKDPKQTKVI